MWNMCAVGTKMCIRDSIEAGTYLERVFPQIGLRFIAIKENYDNFDADGFADWEDSSICS